MSAQTLPSDPSVTIDFDGLIVLVHDEERRLCQAGIHTQAPHHALQISVRKNRSKEVEWPKTQADWDGAHRRVKAVAPLWLYVDSGGGRQESDFSAELYKPDDLDDPQSFGHVLDFEAGFYKRPLGFRSDSLAVLNVAQGVFYSSETGLFLVKPLDERQDSDEAEEVEKIRAASKVTASIEARSAGGVERSLVLEQERPERKTLFRLKLEEGTRYEIEVKNIPEHEMDDSVADHFLQYYKLFPLKEGEKRFVVEPFSRRSEESTDSPPCNVGRASLTTSLT